MSSDKARLIVNLGTPKELTVKAIQEYLAEFLMDPKVIDIPHPLRWLLVHGIVLRTRPKKTLHAYEQIWTANGSPLLVNSKEFVQKLKEIHDSYYLAMTYGEPGIEQILKQIEKDNYKEVIVIPLFPQRASSTTGSIQAAVNKYKRGLKTYFLDSFNSTPPFIDCYAKHLKAFDFKFDHLLFSYHGIPHRHILKEFNNCRPCLKEKNCAKLGDPKCYRRQCYETTDLIGRKLELGFDDYSTSFQSRFGKDKWLTPETVAHTKKLAEQGVQNLAVACPSFVTDGLETLEEIGIRLKEDFLNAGGKEFFLYPSLNSTPNWVSSFNQIADSFHDNLEI